MIPLLCFLCVAFLFLAILSNARRPPTMDERRRNIDRALRDLEERAR